MSPPVYRKSVFCAQLERGDEVREVFCLARVERRTKKSGEPFLTLSLADRSGTVAAVAWDDVDRLGEFLVEGDYARIEGTVGDFRGEPQVTVTSAARVAESVDPAEYLPRGPAPAAESAAGIRALADTIEDRWLGGLVRGMLDDTEFRRAFEAAPAAKVNHHAYVGGLAEHTLSVMRLCDRAAEHYGDLDRDLLLAGAFCHDVGKTVELAVQPGFPYTERGSLEGHIPLGYAMVRARIDATPGFPPDRATDLGHLILSHQGELEWGSPVQPSTLEALVLHFLDNLDSKVGSARTHLAGVEEGRTAYVRSLGRSLFRRAPGDGEAVGGGDDGGERDERPEPPARAGGGPDAGERPGAEPSLFDGVEGNGASDGD